MRVLIAVALLVLTQLSGCSALRYKRIQVDSPSPGATCKTSESGNAVTIARGESCAVPIPADYPLTSTGISVIEGESYLIATLPAQAWYDDKRRLVSLAGEDGSFLMRLGNRWKKKPEQPYFALIATVIRADGVESQTNWISLAGKSGSANGGNNVLDVTESGQLGFYPNDAHRFYGNNKGLIWVRVTRCEGKCAP